VRAPEDASRMERSEQEDAALVSLGVEGGREAE